MISRSLENPLVTPSTELATRVRKRPWNARCCFSSLSRPMRTSLPSMMTERPRGIRFDSSPFGPLTRTNSASACTSTPFGIATGILPTRDTFNLLPNVAEDLAAETLFARLPASDNSLGSRHDRHAQPAQDLRD